MRVTCAFVAVNIIVLANVTVTYIIVAVIYLFYFGSYLLILLWQLPTHSIVAVIYLFYCGSYLPILLWQLSTHTIVAVILIGLVNVRQPPSSLFPMASWFSNATEGI